MTPDEFESHFLNVSQRGQSCARWLKAHYVALTIAGCVMALAAAQASFAAPSYVPSICKNIDGTELCIVSKENLDNCSPRMTTRLRNCARRAQIAND